MKIIIKSPGLRVSRALKNYILEKAPRLERLHDRIVSSEVTLAKEERKAGTAFICAINLSLPGKDEFVKAEAAGFEEAILLAIETAQQKLRTRKTQRLVERKLVSD